jgi:hypothetical protein
MRMPATHPCFGAQFSCRTHNDLQLHKGGFGNTWLKCVRNCIKVEHNTKYLRS